MAPLDRRLDDLLVYLHQLGCAAPPRQTLVTAMSVTGQLLQGVQHSSSRPVRAIAVDSQLRRQLIGGLETDSPNVVGQLIRILFNLGNGLMSVGAVDTDGSPGGNPMLRQEEHDLANLFLFQPALTDSLQSLLPDPFDVQQEIGPVFKDVQCLLVMDRDNSRRQFWANAANGTRMPDTFRCLRRRPDESFLVHPP